MNAGFGIGVIEIVVLLTACTIVIAILRNSKSLKWVAVPIATLVLLAAVAGVVALSSWSDRQGVPATEVPAAVAVYETFNANATPRRSHVMANGGDHPSAEAVLRDHRALRQIDSTMQHATRARLGIIGFGSVFLFGVLLAIPIAARHWIARNKGIAIPLLAVGGVFAMLFMVGLAFVVYFRSMHSAEDSLRAARLSELRAIGESFRRTSPAAESIPEPGPPPAPMQVPVVVTEVAADAAPVELEQPAESATSASAPIEQPADPAVAADAETVPTPVELPDWVKAARLHFNNLDHNPVVLVSDRHATVQDSERQLEQLAALAIARQLCQRRAELGGWLPSNDFLHQSGAIQKRFVEESVLEIGAFAPPMYRSYWQVSVSPAMTDLAYAQWKESAVTQRLMLLGAGAGGLTLLFGLAAAMLRIDAATAGQYRRHMFAAVGFSTSLIAALLVLG